MSCFPENLYIYVVYKIFWDFLFVPLYHLCFMFFIDFVFIFRFYDDFDMFFGTKSGTKLVRRDM